MLFVYGTVCLLFYLSSRRRSWMLRWWVQESVVGRNVCDTPFLWRHPSSKVIETGWPLGILVSDHEAKVLYEMKKNLCISISYFNHIPTRLDHLLKKSPIALQRNSGPVFWTIYFLALSSIFLLIRNGVSWVFGRGRERWPGTVAFKMEKGPKFPKFIHQTEFS